LANLSACLALSLSSLLEILSQLGCDSFSNLSIASSIFDVAIEEARDPILMLSSSLYL